jgi:aryl-alcohol dehydrogenase-like predicted oxidoreductase
MTLRPDPYRDFERPATFAALAELERAAGERGVSLATLGLAWVLTDPGVTAVLVGPRRPEQLAPAIEAVDVDLDEAERAALTGIAVAAAAG